MWMLYDNKVVQAYIRRCVPSCNIHHIILTHTSWEMKPKRGGRVDLPLQYHIFSTENGFMQSRRTFLTSQAGGAIFSMFHRRCISRATPFLPQTEDRRKGASHGQTSSTGCVVQGLITGIRKSPLSNLQPPRSAGTKPSRPSLLSGSGAFSRCVWKRTYNLQKYLLTHRKHRPPNPSPSRHHRRVGSIRGWSIVPPSRETVPFFPHNVTNEVI